MVISPTTRTKEVFEVAFEEAAGDSIVAEGSVEDSAVATKREKNIFFPNNFSPLFNILLS